MMIASEIRKRDGAYFVLLGSMIFLLLGFALEYGVHHPISDFRFVYNGVRCLLRGVDPYKQSEFIRVFQADGGNFGAEPLRSQYLEMSRYMYPPTIAILLPFALLPWTWALASWSLLLAISYILAAYLIWKVSSRTAPLLAGVLIFVLIGSSQITLELANVAGLAISFSIIAAYCFIEERYIVAGALCMSLALLLKPHEAGLIWLFFLLSRGRYRRWALWVLAVVVAASLPLTLWTTKVSPHWPSELSQNLTALSASGGLNDPGPKSMAGHGMEMAINLQAVVSEFWDEARVYNSVSYVIVGCLLLAWCVTTMRVQFTKRTAWIALASVSALTMLPVYHRLYDAKLLLLTVPACAILWAEGGAIASVALVVSGIGLFLTGDFQWALLILLFHKLPRWVESGFAGIALQTFPVPLAMLATGTFYLWALRKYNSNQQKDSLP